MELGADGTYRRFQAGQRVWKGRYAIAGDRIEFSDEAVPSDPNRNRNGCEADAAGKYPVGVYTWAFDGQTLSFTKIEDNCLKRLNELTREPWTRKP